MELIGKVLMLVGVAIGAWVAYKVLHDYLAERRKGTNNEPEAPYKIEFENPTVDVAIPDSTNCHLTPTARDAIKWTFANAPELKPKRKYTKRKYTKRVLITRAEAKIAKKLGLTLEQYARERLNLERPDTKRKYTKRSEYWTSDKPAKRMQKARKAKRKSK